jgi:cbb3-type cytochrome oxidase subunit 3
MKSDKGTEEQFEWDMTAVMLLLLAIVFLLVIVMAFGPLGHTT